MNRGTGSVRTLGLWIRPILRGKLMILNVLKRGAQAYRRCGSRSTGRKEVCAVFNEQLSWLLWLLSVVTNPGTPRDMCSEFSELEWIAHTASAPILKGKRQLHNTVQKNADKKRTCLSVLCETIRLGERKESKANGWQRRKRRLEHTRSRREGEPREGRNKVTKRDKSCIRKELSDTNPSKQWIGGRGGGRRQQRSSMESGKKKKQKFQIMDFQPPLLLLQCWVSQSHRAVHNLLWSLAARLPERAATLWKYSPLPGWLNDPPFVAWRLAGRAEGSG